jgi:hypothetical protein
MGHMHIVRRLLPVAALVAVTTSCGDAVRQGQSSVFLTVITLQAASGGGHDAGKFSGTLLSDVQVLVTSPAPCSAASPCPTVFDDAGQVVLQLTPKNLGVAPTTNNQVTITRYHVTFTRADGRNSPGVDVPYGFDGAITGLVPPTGATTLSFELVRHVAKEETPLVQLISSAVIINTIATVTFYGTDQVGNDVTATTSMSVEFGNFGD